MDEGRSPCREAPRRPRIPAPALAMVLAGIASAAAALALAAPPEVPTRADLDLLRRRVAMLESELALARTRKPYVIVDAQARNVRYGLLGMTVREIPSSAIEIDGLRRVGGGEAAGPTSLAGIITLKEKEKDPRLEPLTPEQIEAGATDENVADALPPEAPDDFHVRFNQPILLRVEGVPDAKSALSGAFGWWGRLWRGAGASETRIALSLAVHVDETAAREIYRSLVPGERLLLVPPAGHVLPDAGLEPPRGLRPGRQARPPAPPPGPPAEGVPFRIPPPVTEEAPAGSGDAEENGSGEAKEGTEAPADEATPEPAPPSEDAPDPGAPSHEAEPRESPAPPADGGA